MTKRPPIWSRVTWGDCGRFMLTNFSRRIHIYSSRWRIPVLLIFCTLGQTTVFLPTRCVRRYRQLTYCLSALYTRNFSATKTNFPFRIISPGCLLFYTGGHNFSISYPSPLDFPVLPVSRYTKLKLNSPERLYLRSGVRSIYLANAEVFLYFCSAIIKRH